MAGSLYVGSFFVVNDNHPMCRNPSLRLTTKAKESQGHRPRRV
jgi:hypothetical protein